MNKKSKSESIETRRSFIKTKVIGGLIGAAGIPLLSYGSFFRNEDYEKATLLKGSDKNNLSWSEIRKNFLLAKDKYYFNTAGLGPSPNLVIDQMYKSTKSLATSALSGHDLMPAIHNKIGAFLNTSADQIALTRNATEGMNIIAQSLSLKAGDEILLTKHEHIGGSAPWIALQKEIGVKIKLVELDLTGKDNLQIIKDNVTDKTKVVSFSHITCTTGLCLPAKEIAAFCRKRGIYSCVDGAQAIGMIAIDLKDINPDFYTCSGHKWLFGPTGTGILYVNKNLLPKINPVFAGAYTDRKFDLNTLTLEYIKDNAQRAEYGTRNISSAVGLASAIDFISEIGIKKVEARGKELAKHFISEIEQQKDVEILTSKNSKYSASIISIRVNGKNNISIRNELSRNHRIHIRTVHENEINGLRISFAIFNSIEEVNLLINALKTMLK
jgi:selenocysteine lyase/cysteine desulfurase